MSEDNRLTTDCGFSSGLIYAFWEERGSHWASTLWETKKSVRKQCEPRFSDEDLNCTMTESSRLQEDHDKDWT